MIGRATIRQRTGLPSKDGAGSHAGLAKASRESRANRIIVRAAAEPA